MRHSVPFHRWMPFTAIGAFAILISVPCWPVDAHTRSGRSTLSTVPRANGSKSLDLEDRNSGETWAPSASGSRSFRTRSGGHSGHGTYNPERIQRFWSHYRGARRQGKSKPLEREK